MFIMSALRFIMVVLICVPMAYLMMLLVDDLERPIKAKEKNERMKKRNSIDGTKRTVHNSGGTRWSR